MGLEKPELTEALFEEMDRMEKEFLWFLQCAVIMPDHVHLLLQLGNVRSLGKCLARFKSKTTPALGTNGLKWQRGYFDRHLRLEENRLPYFLYLYLNPYRANLLTVNSRWPGFYCSEIDAGWFMPYLNDGLPEPEWLAGLP